ALHHQGDRRGGGGAQRAADQERQGRLRVLLLLMIAFPAFAQAPRFPDLQRGQWRLNNNETSPSTMCGHPLQSTYAEIEQLAKLREMGCTTSLTYPKDRSISVHVVCPSNSKIGAVNTLFVISSPNPQSYTVEATLAGRNKTISSGTRTGDC